MEFDEFPQYVANESTQKKLEQLYDGNMLNKTGKTYSGLGIEYELAGHKYVRSKNKHIYSEVLLSDGNEYSCNETVWLEVSPIKWLVDEENNMLISKYILSTKPVDSGSSFKGPFESSELYKYLNSEFIREITPPNGFEISYDIDLEAETNPYNFDLDEVSEEEIIRGMIQSDVPVFLHGPSSEGKSARVKQIDPDRTIIYLRNSTPESLNGKSAYNSETGEMIDKKPTWLVKLEEKCLKEPDKIHILFFDELTNALPSI